MNKKRIFSGALALLMIVSLFAGCTPENNNTEGASNPTESESQPAPTVPEDAITIDGATFISYVADTRAYGTVIPCTVMQGMASSEKYLYVAKEKGDVHAVIIQYDPAKDEQKVMEYYPDLKTNEQAELDNVLHINDMTIFSESNGDSFMLTANAAHPASSSVKGQCLNLMKLDEEKGTLRLVGYFNLTYINGKGETAYLSATSIRHVAQNDKFNYFLVKNGDSFYWCKMPVNATGGTIEKPEEVSCVRLFTVDNRNAQYKAADGTYYTLPNVENWTNQGYFYDERDGLLYIPMWNTKMGNNKRRENAIIIYNVKDLLSIDSMEAVTENQTNVIHPLMPSLHIVNKNDTEFEVESCVFLKNQGANGDLHLYFNTNGVNVKKSEGIWKSDYTQGSVELKNVADENSIIYTVEYNYNVEGVEEADWKQSIDNSNFSMLKDTIHIAGIATNLRYNCFTYTGHKFSGWQLKRQSDGAWLYEDGAWYAEGGAPEGVARKIVKNQESVDNLTTVNGDLITAYAQWKEK